MAASRLTLELLLKLNDQASRGSRSALRAVQAEARNTSRDLQGIATAANRIKTTSIERMTRALRQMQSAAKSAVDLLQKGGQVGAGMLAGGYVLKSAAERPMSYDRRLALLANTAYSDRGVEGRIRGKAVMQASIRNAVRYGGGTPEQAAETLSTLVGSGALGRGKAGIDNALGALPTIQRYATGTGADPNDLARIVVSSIQNLKLEPTAEVINAVLGKVTKGGQVGGFEIADMARHLPSQMALAAGYGMKGFSGLESLIAGNQASRITAGTADEAGNNFTNLLAKINSADTINDFKKQGIDLTGSLIKARQNGVDPLVAFARLVEQVGMKDPKYAALRSKADKQTGDEQQATYSAMADLLLQKGISSVVQDRQAMGALLAMTQQKGMYQEALTAAHIETGKEGDLSYGTVADTSDFKAEQTGNEKAFAAIDALSAIDQPLKNMLDGVNNLAAAHPTAAAASYGLATALTAATVAAAGFSIMGKLGGGKGSVPGLPTPSKSIPYSRMGMTNAGTAVGGGFLARALGPLGLLGAAGYLTYQQESESHDNYIEAIERAKKRINAEQRQKVEITVAVKNGNIVAEVNKENARQGRRN